MKGDIFVAFLRWKTLKMATDFGVIPKSFIWSNYLPAEVEDEFTSLTYFLGKSGNATVLKNTRSSSMYSVCA